MYNTSIKRQMIELSNDISNIEKYKSILLKLNREIEKCFFSLHFLAIDCSLNNSF